MSEFEVSALDRGEVTGDTRLKCAKLKPSYSKHDSRATGQGRTHRCLCDAEAAGSSVVRYCLFHAVLRHCERLERRSSSRTSWESEGARRLSKARWRRRRSSWPYPRMARGGEALYTSHVRRKTGAEAFAAAGIEGAITQIPGRRGKWAILRYGQEAPLAGTPPSGRRQAPPA